MGKLRFFHGCMSAGKSLQLLVKAHNKMERSDNILLLKKSTDIRDINKIKSRIGIEKKCYIFKDIKELKKIITKRLNEIDCIFIDEVQFFTKECVEYLNEIVINTDIDIYAYGLKNTYKNTLFEGAKWLFVYADKIEEIKSRCDFCKNKATTHLLYVNNKLIVNGNDEFIGDKEFKSVCQYCYHVEMKKQGFK